MNNDEPLYTRYLSITDVCKLFNLKESWIRRQIFLKKIPFIKMGRLIRFDLFELDKWVKLK